MYRVWILYDRRRWLLYFLIFSVIGKRNLDYLLHELFRLTLFSLSWIGGHVSSGYGSYANDDFVPGRILINQLVDPSGKRRSLHFVVGRGLILSFTKRFFFRWVSLSSESLVVDLLLWSLTERYSRVVIMKVNCIHSECQCDPNPWSRHPEISDIRCSSSVTRGMVTIIDML